MKKAEELDPLSVDRSRGLATTFYWAGQYDLAVGQARRALELAPKDAQTHEVLADIYSRKGLHKEAIAAQQEVFTLSGDKDTAEALGDDFKAFGYERVMRQLDQITLDGLKESAKSGYVSPVSFATAYSKLGDRNQAFAWLDKALAERSPWLTYIKTDPVFDGLHSDPRFAELLRRIGLPP
jgi:tetratricopeptide (TPR) repeat protein